MLMDKPKPQKKKPAAKKPASKKKKPDILKISAEEKKRFPFPTFPVKLYHKDGKDNKDLKICHFQCIEHAQKYIQRYKFRKNQYLLFEKP